MKKHTVKTAGRIGCAALAAVMAMSSGGTAFASAAATQKDETVYSTLDANGRLKSTTVSDWLHSDGAAAEFLDKSDLNGIKNVKSNENPVRDGGSLVWQLDPSSVGKTGSNIYYEGTTDKKLPLTVSVAYYLNGKEISPAKLAGKSGSVEIKVNIKNNEKHTVKVSGKDTVMYTPMTAVVMTKLPSDTFKNVKLSDGKLISDGKNQFVTFVTMPGLNDSLQLTSYSDIPELSDLDFPEELDIKADVTNFSLDTIAVAATPEIIDSDKLKDSTDIDGMRTNLNKLKKIQDDIDNVDSDKSIRSLFTNSDRTAAARLLIDDVFDFYKLDLKMTDLASDYVTNDNIKLYDRVTSDLDKADIKYLLDNKVLRGINGRLTDENIEKGRTLLNDYDEIETFDMVKLNHVLKALNHYDKLYNSFDDIIDDAERIENHMSTSSLDTISKLTGSGIQGDLSKLMESLDGLSDSGLTGIQLDDSDIQALMENYLNRDGNFEKILASQIKGMADKNGNINISELLSYVNGLNLNSDLKSAIMGQLKGPFAKSNPDAEVSASSLSGILSTYDIDSKYLQGIVGTDGKIKVKSLLGALSTLAKELPLDEQQISALTAQIIPVILKENPDTVLPAEDIIKAAGNAVNKLDANAKSAVISTVAAAAADGTADKLNDMLGNAGQLQEDLADELGDNYEDKLESALGSLSDENKYIENLKDDLNDMVGDDDDDKDTIEDDLDGLKDVILDKDQTDYLIHWGNRIKDMKKDLDGNSENISIMRDLLKQYDDPKIKNAKNMIPTLQNDLDDVRPVLEALKDSLGEPAMNASLHKLPETTKTLLKMQDDINSNRSIMDIFKKTMAPATVSVFKNTFDTLDDFKKDGTVDSYTKKLDDADDLIARKDVYLNLADDYKIFTQAADGADTQLKFVMKTAEIKADDKTVEAEPVSTGQNTGKKNSGFKEWVQSVWNGTANLFRSIF